MIRSHKHFFAQQASTPHNLLFLLSPFQKCINLEVLRHYLDHLRTLQEFELLPILKIDFLINWLLGIGALRRVKGTSFPILEIAPLTKFFLPFHLIHPPPVHSKILDTAFLKTYAKLGKQIFVLLNSKKEYELNIGRFYVGWEIENLLAALDKALQRGMSIDGIWLAIDRCYSLENRQKERLNLAQSILDKMEQTGTEKLSIDLKMDYGELLLRVGHIWSALNRFGKSKEAYLKLLRFHQGHDFGNSQEKALGDIYHNLGIVSYDMKDFPEAEIFFQKAYTVFEKISDTYSQAEVSANLANLATEQKNYDLSRQHYDRAMQFFKKNGDLPGIGLILYNLGLLEEELQNYEKAQRHLLRALSIFQQFGDHLKIASIYRSLGVLADFVGDWHESLDFYKKSIHIFIQLGDEGSVAGIYQNMGVIAKNLGNQPESREYYNRALDIYKQTNSPLGQAQVLQNLGAIAFEEHILPEALSFFQQALAIYKSLDDTFRQAGIYQNLGALFYMQLDFSNSYKYYLLSLEIFLHYKTHDRIQELKDNFQHLATVSGSDWYLEKPLALIQEKIPDDSCISGRKNKI